MSVKLPAVSGSSGRLIVERPPSEDNSGAWPGRIFENLELPYADAMLAFVATAQERASQPASLADADANGSLAAEKRTLGRSEAQLRDARRQVRAQRQLEDAAWQAARGAHRAAAQADQVRPKVARRSAKAARTAQWRALRDQRRATLAARQPDDAAWRQARLELRQCWSALPVVSAWIAILVIVDNCTRQCLGLPLFVAGPKVTAEMIVEALGRLLPPELQFLISDRGTHFTANAFKTLVLSEAFIHVLIARHRPQSNGIAERFVRTLKEWLADKAWLDDQALATLLPQFLVEYGDRPHQGLAMPAGEMNISEKDTVFRLSPVIITATQATERVTPVTFSDLNRTQLAQRYSTQDVPVLLSELPSVTYYSDNGNGIGYNYINVRGFDQRRISIMVNGVPQNDPEDHNVYWIDFPDLMASAGNIQVQRGAGSAFYGPPAIGGSVNLVTNPFMPKPSLTLEAMGGFQEYGDTKSTKLATRKYGVSINSGIVDQRYMFYSRLSKITTDGYRKNASDDLNSYFVGAVRFDENMTTRFHFYGGPFSDGLVYNGVPKFYNKDPKLRRTNYSYFELNAAEDTVAYPTFRKPQEVENFSQPHAELLHDWQISESIVMHNTIFFVQGEGYFDYDGDWVPYYDWNNNPTASNLWFRKYAGYDSTFGVSAFPSLLLRGFVGNKQWGWLPRVDIIHVNGELTLGAEVRIHRSTHWGKIQYASQVPSATYDPDFHIYEYNGEKRYAFVVRSRTLSSPR